MSLEFECAQYAAPASTNVVELRVILDGDTATPGAQPVPNGLFSYGFVVHFDAAQLEPLSEGAVHVEPALDYSGFNHAALLTRGKDFLTAKGNINPSGPPYAGTNLAVVRLRVIGAPLVSTTVTLEVFEEGASEAVFVNGAGTEIDPVITSRSSPLTVLEPLRIEWVDGPGPVAPHARLTYGVHPAFDFQVQATESLDSGRWQSLPGAPHNGGTVLDFSATRQRFYRVVTFKR